MTNTAMTNAVKVGIHNRTGRKVDEIIYDFQSVSWLLSGVGQLPLTLPYSNPKTTKSNLALGNLVTVQFSNGLPAWAGVMDTPLRQTSTDVSVTVYAAKKVLEFRETSKSLIISGSPGGVFWQIIQNLNTTADTQIGLGTIATEGETVEREYHFTDALSAIQDLARSSGHDWDILPFLDERGKLTLTANWWTKRGLDRTNIVTLEEGKNAEFTLEAQGRIASRVRAVGSGGSWGDARPVATTNNEDTQNLYGFREKTIVDTSIPSTSESALQAAANGYASTLNAPLSRLTAMTTNQAPGLFANYDLGDRVHVRAFLKASPEWVVDTSYRLRGREFLSTNICRLTLEVN